VNTSRIWRSLFIGLVSAAAAIGASVANHASAASCAPSSGSIELVESGTAWSIHATGFENVIPGTQFAVELALCDAPAGTEIIEATASMPAHGHGMNYRPEIHDNAHGDIVSSGWLMHMPGRWQVSVKTRLGSDYHTFIGDIIVSP